jgi:hypothetical protein
MMIQPSISILKLIDIGNFLRGAGYGKYDDEDPMIFIHEITDLISIASDLRSDLADNSADSNPTVACDQWDKLLAKVEGIEPGSYVISNNGKTGLYVGPQDGNPLERKIEPGESLMVDDVDASYPPVDHQDPSKRIFNVIEDGGDLYQYSVFTPEDGLVILDRPFKTHGFFETYYLDSRKNWTELTIQYKTGMGEGKLVIPCGIFCELPVVAALVNQVTKGKTFNNIKIFGGEPLVDLFKESE